MTSSIRQGTRSPVNANGRRANAGPFAVFIGVEPTAKVANPQDPTVDALVGTGPHAKREGRSPPIPTLHPSLASRPTV
jgi:hypothetical protein